MPQISQLQRESMGFESRWVMLWNVCFFKEFTFTVWSIWITYSLYLLYSGRRKRVAWWWRDEIYWTMEWRLRPMLQADIISQCWFSVLGCFLDTLIVSSGIHISTFCFHCHHLTKTSLFCTFLNSFSLMDVCSVAVFWRVYNVSSWRFNFTQW